LVYRLQSKNCRFHLPHPISVPSPVQELQFSPTASNCCNVSSPRTAVFTYRIQLVYRLQSKNCSFLLPHPIGVPSPVQELQFSPTASDCFTVSSPRTAIFTYCIQLVYRLQSKNCSFYLPHPIGVPSPVQELQFSPTASNWFTVSSPRTAVFTYRIQLVYRLQSKNCSFHLPHPIGVPSPVQELQFFTYLMNSIRIKNCSLQLPAPLDGPVATRHLRIQIQYSVRPLCVPVSSSLFQYPASLCSPVASPHPTVAPLCTTI